MHVILLLKKEPFFPWDLVPVDILPMRCLHYRLSKKLA